jgi:hypothetical protein
LSYKLTLGGAAKMEEKFPILLATPAGFEPATFSLEGFQENVTDQRMLRLFQALKTAFCSKS